MSERPNKRRHYICGAFRGRELIANRIIPILENVNEGTDQIDAAHERFFYSDRKVL